MKARYNFTVALLASVSLLTLHPGAKDKKNDPDDIRNRDV
jgi:hypothetical protein